MLVDAVDVPELLAADLVLLVVAATGIYTELYQLSYAVWSVLSQVLDFTRPSGSAVAFIERVSVLTSVDSSVVELSVEGRDAEQQYST